MTPHEHPWGSSLAADEIFALVAGCAPSLVPKWRLIVLQAYIDDSRRDGAMVLGGFIGSIENWVHLAREWEELLPLATFNKHGRREFKMAEMMQNPGRVENIQPFFRLIERSNLLAVCSYVHQLDVEWALNKVCRSDSLRRSLRIVSGPFVLTYRLLMDGIVGGRDKISFWLPDGVPVDFIFDEESQKDIVLSTYKEYTETRPYPRENFGKTPVFRDSERFVALQAADLWAGFMRRRIAEQDQESIIRFSSWQGKVPLRSLEYIATKEDLVRIFSSILAESQPNYISGNPRLKFNI